MAITVKRNRLRKYLIITGSVVLAGFLFLLVFVNRFIEPILKDRLHTLIIQGSDSLYTYSLGKLQANFYGGNVEVENLQIQVDSARYAYLKKRNALPSLTMDLTLGRGHLKGIGILDLIFGKKVRIHEILSRDANLKLSRHVRPYDVPSASVPLWKAMEPKISSIDIDRIQLDGVKMNYKNADTSESLKLEFEGCDALFRDIRIDSAAAFDTARIGFASSILLNIQEVKYRTPDSVYKLKIDTVSYSSSDRILEMRDFKFQPTLNQFLFYQDRTVQKTMYTVRFDRIRFTNLHLDHFILNNVIDPDSAIFENPVIGIYTDRTLTPEFESKIGRYPHQHLLKSSAIIDIKNLLIRNGVLGYTEKNAKTLQEGMLKMNQLQLVADNLTNDPDRIKMDPVMRASMSGRILETTPFRINFRFLMDSTNGRYEASGKVDQVTADQLNSISQPLGNVQINSGTIQQLIFKVRGEDYSAESDVRMRYSGMALTFRKLDEETGIVKTQKFLTKLVNKFIMHPSNPGPDGLERTASQHKVLRLTTQSFFALLWKTIFAGMQDIMLKAGRYD
jgi:hypothetical protein